MANDNKFFEDLTKLAGSAMDTAFHSASECKSQFESVVNASVTHYLSQQLLVPKEDYDVLFELVQTLKIDQETLKKRIQNLEDKNDSTIDVE